MKLRNFANKFLLVTLLVIFTFSNFTVASTPSITNLAPTEVSGYANKSYYFDQYNVNKPTDESLYTALGIKVYNDYLTALSATKNLKEVVVAVVDTGIDIDHPVFTNRVLTQYAMDFSKGLPTSEVNEWDKYENGHGTHVAGIIANLTPDNIKLLV
ncbi:MAG: S8 family serine peptidase, partial [Clostridia bacterium]|nr:S8 family serine peptidase [Clostridia bacterium]